MLPPPSHSKRQYPRKGVKLQNNDGGIESLTLKHPACQKSSLSSIPFYDKVTYIVNDKQATYEMDKRNYNNTETWSANLPMTELSTVVSTDESPDTLDRQ